MSSYMNSRLIICAVLNTRKSTPITMVGTFISEISILQTFKLLKQLFLDYQNIFQKQQSSIPYFTFYSASRQPVLLCFFMLGLRRNAGNQQLQKKNCSAKLSVSHKQAFMTRLLKLKNEKSKYVFNWAPKNMQQASANISFRFKTINKPHALKYFILKIRTLFLGHLEK